MIIGLGRASGSGKDTVGQYLVDHHGFTRLAFADKLKELALEMNPFFPDLYDHLRSMVQTDGWSHTKERMDTSRWYDHEEMRFPVREYLQNLGVSLRTVMGDDIWVDQVERRIDWLDPTKRYVITDVRFLNEVRFVHDGGGEVWELLGRQAVSTRNSHHPSEVGDFESDRVIDNRGTLDELYRQVEENLSLYWEA